MTAQPSSDALRLIARETDLELDTDAGALNVAGEPRLLTPPERELLESVWPLLEAGP